MASVFSIGPGTVAIADRIPTMPLSLTLGGWTNGLAVTTKAILTGVGVQSTGNYQPQHTLRDHVYIFVFGERVATLTLTGMTFVNSCAGGGQPGIVTAIDYYARNRLSQKGEPITVQIGPTGAGLIRGFLVGIQAENRDPETLLGGFSFTFQFFPQSAASS